MSDAPPLDNARYERKFFVDQLDRHQVRAILMTHPGMFFEVYPPRFVNNIYLDNPWMDNYVDNVGGAPDRMKARVRWYHQFFRKVDDPILELKVKRGMVGYKVQHSIFPFTLDERFNDWYFEGVIRASQLPPDVLAHLLTLEVALLNRYHREYFATADGKFRVTIDSGLTFYHVNKLNNQFLYRQVDYANIVVELKYLPEHDPQAQRITSAFPFRATRSSKYVQGIERVYL